MSKPMLARAACALLLLGAGPASAQAPQQAPTPTPSPAPEVAAKDVLKDLLEKVLAVQPGQYTYQPGGRRDPFISLLVNIGPSIGTQVRPPGVQGLLIQETALKGIVKDQTGYIAMLLGPADKNYFVRVGQRLYDGVITAMDAATVTFRQEVTDPLSPVKTRDVKKSLYSSEEARQ